ncbi:hypothetical protein V865_004215 [Kwoniella europaea PYCC6329]|uniref:NAD-dependent epimerase/dehydratase domain-containing protein n=1 Tax=Kwoniella europaea PYCC6329 TaxID=1423913 RepID=A0AAX4KKG8_9TREE
MAASVPKLLVVGGNGFLGSAICKAAVTKGWEVSSMSSSGKPYTTPAGHSPAWSSKVQWAQADAFDPSTYEHLIKDRTSVVHTLGILLEDTGYKASIRQGDLLGLAGSLIKSTNLGGGDGNPLKSEGDKKRGYEGMNRDSAIKVLDTFLSTSISSSSTPSSIAKQFIYISAADAFRPLIPSRYIETKREAELEIARRCQVYNHPEQEHGQNENEIVKPIFIRPGLMYHPHIRPLTTLPAFLIDLSSKLSLRSGIPNPFASKSPLHGALESMRTFPLHVDHVANSVLRCIEESRALGQEQEEGEGWGGARVVEVQQMREWAGLGRK